MRGQQKGPLGHAPLEVGEGPLEADDALAEALVLLAQGRGRALRRLLGLGHLREGLEPRHHLPAVGARERRN